MTNNNQPTDDQSQQSTDESVISSPSQSQRPTMSGAPHVASDADLIEKAWVDKAKEIVEHTKNDPYEQQKAISKFKADYMKKRYNKDINVADS